MAEQGNKPTVGRIVHYFAYGTPGGEYPAGVARAAIVTTVHPGIRHPVDSADEAPGLIDLCVLNPTGMLFVQGVRQAQHNNEPGCWDWPPRV